MTARFATTCDTDGCTARSREFARFPVCHVCLGDFCRLHITPGSLDEESGRALCRGCASVLKQDVEESFRMAFIADRGLQWARDFREAVR